MNTAIRLSERGLLPDPVIRWGIRRLLRERLRSEEARANGDAAEARARWLAEMRSAPIALHGDAANEQHYEIPAAFFELVLGARLKYSSAYWPEGVNDLDEAEEAMLALTCERAGLADGQRILELGCGWGSLTLWMAERYPRARILALSNSASQRRHVLATARERGLGNLEVATGDVAEWDTDRRFDRVVSVEMFEHMRNWEALLARVHRWLLPDGRLFLHVFAHRRHAYPFADASSADWMAREFFTGGMMPSHDLPLAVDSPFRAERSWVVSGTHYARTARAWLRRLDRRRDEVREVLAGVYGAEEAAMRTQRWRMFFLACAELFGYRQGREWWVSHHLLAPAAHEEATAADAEARP